MNDLRGAYEFFWDGHEPKEFLRTPEAYNAGSINFFEWVVYDWRPEDDEKPLTELYAASKKKITPEERGVLDKMGNAYISLYEVQAVFPEEGLRLKDLFTGKERDVKEKAATRSLNKWDIFASRLLEIDDDNIMSGCSYSYHREEKEGIIKHIKKCFKDYKGENPDAFLSDFLKKHGYLFNYYWYDRILNPVIPKVFTTSGEAMLLSKAIFEIKDLAGVLRGLKEIKKFDEIDEGVFQWLDEEKPDGTSTLLGTVKVKADTLYLESNSRERLEKGKALIIEYMAGSVKHKTDVFQDAFQAVRHMDDAHKQTAGDEIPGEIEQELYDQFMRRHYEKWVDEQIPALNNKTPLEAVKTPAGRKKVIDLLKGIENLEEQKKRSGETHSDISWLWERLGIER